MNISYHAQQVSLGLFEAAEPVHHFAEVDSEGRGAVFTQREVVEFILDLTGYRPLHSFRLLEPSPDTRGWTLSGELPDAWGRFHRPGESHFVLFVVLVVSVLSSYPSYPSYKPYCLLHFGDDIRASSPKNRHLPAFDFFCIIGKPIGRSPRSPAHGPLATELPYFLSKILFLPQLSECRILYVQAVCNDKR